MFFGWTQHNYLDVELDRQGSDNAAYDTHERLKRYGWRGWPYEDPQNPYVLLTEGGAKTNQVGTEAIQAERVGAAWERMREVRTNPQTGGTEPRISDGIGMFTNYLMWSTVGHDSGLCRPIDDIGQIREDWDVGNYRRALFDRWKDLPTQTPRDLPAPAWGDWEGLGGNLASGPAATSWGVGRIDVAARFQDGRLMHRYFESVSGWSNWGAFEPPPTGGTWQGDPAMCSWGRDRLDVFAIGPDRAVWHKYWQGGWSGWRSLGGQTLHSPTACSWSSGRLDVFVVGTDGQIYQKWSGSGGESWSEWWPLGGGCTSTPAATAWSPGRIDLFVRGTDYQMHHLWYAGTWSWEPLGGFFISGPGTCSWRAGVLSVVGLSSDNAAYHKGFADDYGWTSWWSLGGVGTSDPDIASWGSGKLDVFVRDTGNGLSRATIDVMMSVSAT